MALESPGFGVFNPASAYRKGPQAEERGIEGEARTRANYLIGIDAVNLQIELQREGLKQQREIFEKEFGLKERGFEREGEQYEREFEREEERYGPEFGLEERDVATRERQVDIAGRSDYWRGRELGVTEDIYGDILGMVEERWKGSDLRGGATGEGLPSDRGNPFARYEAAATEEYGKDFGVGISELYKREAA